MPSMQRFFGSESESSTLSTPDKPRPPLMDPLHAILGLASQSEGGLTRSLLYLSMLTKSGVNIPSSFFVQISKLIDFNGPNSLDNANTLLKAIFLCLWQTSIGRQELQSLIAMLHSRLANQVLECLLSGKGASVAYVDSASLSMDVDSLQLKVIYDSSFPCSLLATLWLWKDQHQRCWYNCGYRCTTTTFSVRDHGHC
jgi:hypothetical protein